MEETPPAGVRHCSIGYGWQTIPYGAVADTRRRGSGSADSRKSRPNINRGVLGI
ncbi:MAG: hypothetical protein MUE85_17670 [Microscillaceae bacterium]|nr:hypothetical protein [Microscillaceae bacterium]